MSLEKSMEVLSGKIDSFSEAIANLTESLKNVSIDDAAGKSGNKTPPKNEKKESGSNEEKPNSQIDDNGETPDVEAVIQALGTYAQEKSKKEAMKLLAKYKAKKVGDLKEKDYEKFIAECE